MPDQSLAVFNELQRVAGKLGLEVVLVGALARQIIFDVPLRGEPYRATYDLDAVLAVDGWKQFERLIRALEENGFKHVRDQHFRYRDGTEVDLLPYGGVEDEAGNLDWESDRVISLRGVRTAAENADSVESDGISIRLVNLPGLLILKLIAFRDRHERERKDLEDILYLLLNATEVLGEEAYAVLGEELAELDYESVGAYYLGLRVAQIVTRDEQEELKQIVDGHLLDDPEHRSIAAVERRNFEEAVAAVEAFRRGLRAVE